MIDPHNALKIIFGNTHPLSALSRPLIESFGYTLAEDIHSDRDQPASDRSAMDGYAVISSDLSECPCSLRIIGEIPAGTPARTHVTPGTCVRIYTGANIPAGADTVVKVEDTEERADSVQFNESTEQGTNIRRRGEEALKDALLLPRGTILGPVQTGLAATVGKENVNVIAHPRIAVISTGSELRDIGDAVDSHEIRDSNGPSLRAAISLSGYTDISFQRLPDNVKTIAEEMERVTSQNDVTILTGGVSVGKYDYVPEAVKAVGASIRFHRVAMKPGRPILYATLPGNRHIFGLPGNPLSVLNGFYAFVLPALSRLAGVDEELCRQSITLPLYHTVVSKKDLVRYVLARITGNSAGPVAEPLDSMGSADLAAGRQADGVVVLPANRGEIEEGSRVEFLPWRSKPW